MKERPAMRSALFRLPIIATVGGLCGCATSLSEQEQFEREYARVERKESIRLYVAEGEQAGHTVVYSGPSYQKLRDPRKSIPGHARLTDYQCVSSDAVNREFGTSSY